MSHRLRRFGRDAEFGSLKKRGAFGKKHYLWVLTPEPGVATSFKVS